MEMSQLCDISIMYSLINGCILIISEKYGKMLEYLRENTAAMRENPYTFILLYSISLLLFHLLSLQYLYFCLMKSDIRKLLKSICITIDDINLFKEYKEKQGIYISMSQKITY